MVSKSWKELSPEQRAPWDEMARKDKARFELEKSLYDGPWKVPDVKDPLAPKRPVSAFLLFSKAKRNIVKRDSRFRTTTEISSVLSKMWKDASDEERKEYLDRDMEDRKRYKKELLEYERIVSKGRNEREALAARFVEDESFSHHTAGSVGDEELSLTMATAEEQQRKEQEVTLERASPGLQFAEECSHAPIQEPRSTMTDDWTTDQLVETSKESRDQHMSSHLDCTRSPFLQDLLSCGVNEPSVSSQRDLFDDFTGSQHESAIEEASSWDPIPLNAPVADFDIYSVSETEFTDSPIATQSTISDTSLRVVTPMKRPAFSHARSESRHKPPYDFHPPRHSQGYAEPLLRPYRYGKVFSQQHRWDTGHRQNGCPTDTVEDPTRYFSSLKEVDEQDTGMDMGHWEFNI